MLYTKRGLSEFVFYNGNTTAQKYTIIRIKSSRDQGYDLIVLEVMAIILVDIVIFIGCFVF